MIFNRYYDLFLLKFPIYLPILYCFILYLYPNNEYILVFFTLAILAEPHFGATWPFFINKINKVKIFSDKIYFIYYPFFIIASSIFAYFYLNYFFLLIFFAVNIYHVTRQSYGISKLFIKDDNELSYQMYAIFFAGFLFFIVGILRFYMNIINTENIFIFNLLILIIALIFFLFYLYKFKFTENFFLLFTGVVIFYPICFVETPIHGIVMGVTMHYIQYLALTYKVVSKRREQFKSNNKINYTFILFVLLYGIFMAFLSFSNRLDNDTFKALLIIPLLGQMLHFYFDALLWKFSDKHNREATLKFLKS